MYQILSTVHLNQNCDKKSTDCKYESCFDSLLYGTLISIFSFSLLRLSEASPN